MVGGKTGVGDQNQSNRASSSSYPDLQVGRFQLDFRSLWCLATTDQSRNYTGHNCYVRSGDGLGLSMADGAPSRGGGKAGRPFTQKLPYLPSGSLLGESNPPSVEIGDQRPQGLFGIDQRNLSGKRLCGRSLGGAFISGGYDFFFTWVSSPGSVTPSPLGAETSTPRFSFHRWPHLPQLSWKAS